MRGFAILDTPQEREFDTIVLLAQKLLGVPIARVSLVDEHCHGFKAQCLFGSRKMLGPTAAARRAA